MIGWRVRRSYLSGCWRHCRTGEDALLARPLVAATGARQLLVVTSDFHVARATWHFRAVFPDYGLDVVGAPYLASCAPVEREQLVAHEARRLAALEGRG